eukprot:469272-Rhodomonas_salina.3
MQALTWSEVRPQAAEAGGGAQGTQDYGARSCPRGAFCRRRLRCGAQRRRHARLGTSLLCHVRYSHSERCRICICAWYEMSSADEVMVLWRGVRCLVLTPRVVILGASTSSTLTPKSQTTTWNCASSGAALRGSEFRVQVLDRDWRGGVAPAAVQPEDDAVSGLFSDPEMRSVAFREQTRLLSTKGQAVEPQKQQQPRLFALREHVARSFVRPGRSRDSHLRTLSDAPCSTGGLKRVASSFASAASSTGKQRSVRWERSVEEREELLRRGRGGLGGSRGMSHQGYYSYGWRSTQDRKSREPNSVTCVKGAGTNAFPLSLPASATADWHDAEQKDWLAFTGLSTRMCGFACLVAPR